MPNIEVVAVEEAGLACLASGSRDIIYISPLEVAFSQNVIYPKFSDGKSVDDAMRLIREDPGGSAFESDDGDEVLLEAPFPTIEAVRWAPKIRDGEGRPLLDDRGCQRLGAEGLFTVDNRRLYALQRAAVSRYPRRCRVTVAVITDRYEVLRHIKKFRTRTNGMSISVSEWNGVGRDNARSYSTMRVWDWRSAVARLEEGGPEAVRAAAEAGSCGCWEYLDGQDVRRGPFSNWQMRQWWDRRMLPPNLLVRPYDALASSADKWASDNDQEGAEFRPVEEVFQHAPQPFAPGWSPRTTDQDAEWRRCAQCKRKRWEGRAAHGEWYCATCWRRWDSRSG